MMNTHNLAYNIILYIVIHRYPCIINRYIIIIITLAEREGGVAAAASEVRWVYGADGWRWSGLRGGIGIDIIYIGKQSIPICYKQPDEHLPAGRRPSRVRYYIFATRSRLSKLCNYPFL